MVIYSVFKAKCIDLHGCSEGSFFAIPLNHAKLVIIDPDSDKLREADMTDLIQGGELSIGRSSGCHLRIINDAISRLHCVIKKTSADEFYLEDLNSKNGTFLNGKRILNQIKLKNNDKVEIANIEITIHIPK